MPSSTPADLTYFLHIPKTSGSSVREWLVMALGAEHVSPQLAWDHLLERPDALNPATTVICGHLGGLLPLWLRRWPRTITMLRDPVARALSHINHVQQDAGHLLHAQAAGLDVVQYCEHPALRKTVENFQARYLASLSFARALVPPAADRSDGWQFGTHAIRFENALYALDRAGALADEAMAAVDALDAVGLCEAHSASLELFASTLGLPPGRRPGEVRANVRDGGWRLDQLSARQRGALQELNEVDLALYRHGARRFAEACARRGIAIDRVVLDRIGCG